MIQTVFVHRVVVVSNHRERVYSWYHVIVIAGPVTTTVTHSRITINMINQLPFVVTMVTVIILRLYLLTRKKCGLKL